MSDADEAFERAQAAIRVAAKTGATDLDLSVMESFDALDRLPGEITTLTALQSLYLENNKVTDLALLEGLPALHSLDLTDTQITDITPLLGLPVLQSLNLQDTQVTDLAPLAGLPTLRSVDLTNTPVTDLGPLAGLPALQNLYLTDTQVADLAPLKGLPALQTLYLTNTKVTDLAPLTNLPALQSLYLGGTQVTDLTPLANLPALQSLYLAGTQVTDLAPLAGLPPLRSLWLDNTQVSDLRPLGDLTRFIEAAQVKGRGLDFENTPLTHCDRRFDELSKIADHETRNRETWAYVQSLPDNWPDNLAPPPIQEEPARSKPPAPTETLRAQANFLLAAAPITRETAQTLEHQLDHAITEFLRQAQLNDLPDEVKVYGYLKTAMAALARATAPGQHASADDVAKQLAQMEQVALELARLLEGQFAAAQDEIARLTQQCDALRRKSDKADRLRGVAERALQAAKDDTSFIPQYRQHAAVSLGRFTGPAALAVPITYFLGSGHPLVAVLAKLAGG